MTLQIRQGDILLRRVADTIEDFQKNPPRGVRGFNPTGNTRASVQIKDNDDALAVVGFGEGSGHRHVVEGAVQTLVQERATEETVRAYLMGELTEEFFMYVNVETPGRLVHQDATETVFEEDHGVLEVPPGVYEVTRQREYDESLDRRYVVD
jgi:hypothetical protein